MKHDTIYKSEISYGLLGTLCFLLLGIPVIQILNSNIHWENYVIVLLIQCCTLLFVVYLFLNTYYSIEGDVLNVKSGMVYKKTIKISEIKAISKTNSLLSSPAASLTKRIEISYGKFNSVIISPKNQLCFVEALQRINPNIVIKI